MHVHPSLRRRVIIPRSLLPHLPSSWATWVVVGGGVESNTPFPNSARTPWLLRAVPALPPALRLTWPLCAGDQLSSRVCCCPHRGTRRGPGHGTCCPVSSSRSLKGAPPHVPRARPALGLCVPEHLQSQVTARLGEAREAEVGLAPMGPRGR